MATLALVTLPLAGHMNPMLAAARALAAQGHRPVVVGPVDVVARVPDDMETLSVGEADMPLGELDAQCACLSRMSSFADMQAMFGLVARLSRFYLDHLPGAVERLGATAILHDQLEPGAGLVARGLGRSLGTAHISLACALPMNREAAVPPPFMGWRYNPSGFGQWLNGGYYNVVDWLLKEQGAVLEAGAKRFGLAKPARNADGTKLEDFQRAWSVADGLSRTHDLAQGLATLDFPRAAPPAYLGPFREDTSRFPGMDSIADERDGRALCFITLGTLMGGRAEVLRAMAGAAISRGLQPVMVHGGRLAEGEAMPAGTIVRDFLDQRAVLRHSAAAIIHGGYNSTVDAVAAGVPLVTVPIAFEQSAIAARLRRASLASVVSKRASGLERRIARGLAEATTSELMAQARHRARFEALAAPGLHGLVAAVDSALDGGRVTPVCAPLPVSAGEPRPYGFVPVPAE